ncbi:hypothetical protein C5Y96_04570 [Blastopirellula marina]|uniref:Carboxypeptidase regulatory-like domain-containing protein n=1 Tax=Blastopirellula marina TaxID=124 RepID=A0A2S8G4E7_9BACT|nr:MULTISPECIES: hypothetical protein [Pirellulaceae]PQO39141.1 hypothetical protein C5Y96_04570 [Blastopirellula marina]RCS55449.1 hypothetical protein DTL36_04580 [Bremerella cremea]
MAITSSRSLMCSALLVIVALVGCNGDGKLSIDGTATWNGQPIQKGYIELQPVGDGHFASAEIVDGKFRLQTTPGKRLVKVTAEKKIGETPPTDRIPEAKPIMFQFVPPKFNSESTLEMDITASNPTLEVALEGSELQPKSGLSTEDKRRMNLQAGGRR